MVEFVGTNTGTGGSIPRYSRRSASRYAQEYALPGYSQIRNSFNRARSGVDSNTPTGRKTMRELLAGMGAGFANVMSGAETAGFDRAEAENEAAWAEYYAKQARDQGNQQDTTYQNEPNDYYTEADRKEDYDYERKQERMRRMFGRAYGGSYAQDSTNQGNRNERRSFSENSQSYAARLKSLLELMNRGSDSTGGNTGGNAGGVNTAIANYEGKYRKG